MAVDLCVVVAPADNSNKWQKEHVCEVLDWIGCGHQLSFLDDGNAGVSFGIGASIQCH